MEKQTLVVLRLLVKITFKVEMSKKKIHFIKKNEKKKAIFMTWLTPFIINAFSVSHFIKSLSISISV